MSTIGLACSNWSGKSVQRFGVEWIADRPWVEEALSYVSDLRKVFILFLIEMR